MLCFLITLVIAHLPPLDMYYELIIRALRAFEAAFSVRQNHLAEMAVLASSLI
jgi:hypothetical protein